MRGREIIREAYFDDIFTSISNHLWHAQRSIKICVAWITADRLEGLLQELKKRGVSIEIVFDDNRSNWPVRNQLGELGELYPVRNWLGAFMHNKFCIIDDEILITGSFNWTKRADISLENALTVAGDYRLIKDYLHEFEDLKDYSRSLSTPRPTTPRHDDGSICCSLTFNVGVFGYLDETRGTQTITIWNVCKAHRYCRAVETVEVEDDSAYDDGSGNEFVDNSHASREEMLFQFERERKERNAPRSWFSREMEAKIHAYGSVRPVPQPFKYEAEIDEDYFLDLEWRHPYWRKIIPAKLCYEDGDIWKIITTHRPNSMNRAYLRESPWLDSPD